MDSSVKAKLEEIRETYRTKSLKEIISIGWLNLEPIKIGNKTYYPAVWSQEYEENEAILIVQLTKWYIPKLFGSTDCIGFIMDEGDSTTDVDAYWIMHESGHP